MTIVLDLEYIRLAPGFVREVLDVYETWEGREATPMKVKELMMVLQIRSVSTLQEQIILLA